MPACGAEAGKSLLTHFAAERKLVADNGYKDLVAMPFRVDRMTVDGKEDTQVGIFR